MLETTEARSLVIRHKTEERASKTYLISEIKVYLLSLCEHMTGMAHRIRGTEHTQQIPEAFILAYRGCDRYRPARHGGVSLYRYRARPLMIIAAYSVLPYRQRIVGAEPKGTHMHELALAGIELLRAYQFSGILKPDSNLSLASRTCESGHTLFLGSICKLAFFAMRTRYYDALSYL